MGSKGSKSKSSREGGTENTPGNIPPESPLGGMLLNWDASTMTKDKDKEKMIKYCCFIWTKESIQPPSVFWSKYGTNEDWVCQILNIYVNHKQPYSEEESRYADCWRGDVDNRLEGYRMYALKVPEGGEKQKPSAPERRQWEVLDHLPPPFNQPLLNLPPPPYPNPSNQVPVLGPIVLEKGGSPAPRADSPIRGAEGGESNVTKEPPPNKSHQGRLGS